MSLLDAARGIVNASQPLPWLVVSGQPSADQLRALVDAGVATVIDIREDMEARGFEEAGAVASTGARYVNAAVVSGALDDASMTRVLDAMREARHLPTLMHCNSANRTGGPLLAYLLIEEHVDHDMAVDQAMQSGLRSVEVLEWAIDYAARHSS
jgi:protein tyrosine phosphatase (PTP) superfamily phosphohydrolase (DUF442 family)